jgi:hypothetical protein
LEAEAKAGGPPAISFAAGDNGVADPDQTHHTIPSFGAFDFVGIFVIYFFAVETKRLSLEEIDQVFLEPNPRTYSIQLAAARRKELKALKANGGARV